eukprot:scaffold2587_cov101-Cylindrotheca_fusiformis.AAC.2
METHPLALLLLSMDYPPSECATAALSLPRNGRTGSSTACSKENDVFSTRTCGGILYSFEDRYM